MSLRLLQVKARLREAVEVADVVVVEVGEDHVLDVLRGYAEQPEGVDGVAEVRALAARRDFLGEAAIDDEAAALADHQPEEVVHRHGAVVRVAAYKIVLPAAVAGGVADGVHLVGRQGGRLGHGCGSRRTA